MNTSMRTFGETMARLLVIAGVFATGCSGNSTSGANTVSAGGTTNGSSGDTTRASVGGTAGASVGGTAGISGTGGNTGGASTQPSTDLLSPDRAVPWKPGRPDGIPVYLQDKTACATGCDFSTHTDDATNDSTPIQNCLKATAPGHACVLGAGTYSLSAALYVPANVVLRGQGPTSTTLHLRSTDGYAVILGSKSFSFDGQVDQPIASGFSKGSTSLQMAATPGFAVGDYVAVTENNDPTLVNAIGEDGDCTWCGGPWNNGAGTQTMAQLVHVTGISGTTAIIDRPLYFTFSANLSPVALRIPNVTENAGVEDLAIVQSGAVDSENHGLVTFDACAGCWAQNIDLSAASSEFVEFNWSKGCVLRDSNIHDPQRADSGRGYGAHVLYWNSDHLVENNLFEKTRHAVAYEGGGSGCVIGYNYLYRDWESDSDKVWLGDDLIFHGAHPYMNLAEGNIHQQYIGDNIWGSSSHNTYFRNQATAAGDWPAVATENRTSIVLVQWNRWHNLVGNVLGTPNTTVTSGPSSHCGADGLWSIGCSGISSSESPPGDPQVLASLVHCGNYSFASSAGNNLQAGFSGAPLPGVDASCSAAIPASLYLTSKPTWFGTCPWPPIGPDVSGFVTDIPAKRMREHGSYTYGCP